ncbi:MAG: 30S ribosomal protein S2, partial [Chloroflexota bacterium]
MVTTVTAIEEAPQPASAPRPLVTLEPGQSQAVTMRILLEAGVHFGHQTKRWNPKMRPYIFTERNGIHIVDLAQTVAGLNSAAAFVSELAAQGGRLMMVGTKKQAQDVISEEAKRCGQFYVNKRWPGGLLTNFVTIRQRLRYLADLEARQARGEIDQLPKQEAKKLTEEMTKLNDVLGGIKQMYDLHSAIFVVDPHKERIAMAEALRLEIPVIAIADTNCDPDEVDYVIPGNDDAIRSVKIVTARLASAFIDGINRRESQRAEQMVSEQEERGGRDRGGEREERGGRDRGGRGRGGRD